MKLRIPITAFFFLCLGCASLPGGKLTTVANRKVEYVLSRGQNPAVIFESGLGGEYHWWAHVFPEIAKTQTSFAYNRPGLGKSEPTSTPRDAQHAVAELRQTLQELRVDPPYILVGHSLGGLYFQYFARRYPKEVMALILVDSTHPEQMQGDGAVERWPWAIRKTVDLVTPKAGLAELDQINATGQQVLAMPALNSQKIPTIILLASQPENPSTPLEKHAVEKRQDFHRLYPDATFVNVPGDHSIPLHSPGLIIQKIKELLPSREKP